VPKKFNCIQISVKIRYNRKKKYQIKHTKKLRNINRQKHQHENTKKTIKKITIKITHLAHFSVQNENIPLFYLIFQLSKPS